MTASSATAEEYDVLIIGAGISGISAAYHLHTHCPTKKYKILERRSQLGGTWDFFDYPGLRSDSDMYTFSFSWSPWSMNNSGAEIIAPKDKILLYLKDIARAYKIDQNIIYGVHVQTANWDSHQATWTLDGTRSGKKVTYRAQFLFVCSGYYSYEHAFQPTFAGAENFQGPIIHPQNWAKNIDYKGKHVVVIGSGATAVTLIPALLKGDGAAKHVTMLQRSPTFIASRPSRAMAVPRFLARYFGDHVARWYYILFSMLIYNYCRFFPEQSKRLLIQQIKRQVGEEHFDERDFTPRYNPWDQRLCCCPDGDFFQTIKDGKTSVVTDHIVEFTKTGIRLEERKEELQADMIVTATGLQILFGGGIHFSMDGNTMVPSSRFVYKGFMANDAPNIFVAMGYTNASWTLKVDMTNKAACRLINYIDRHGYRYCMPQVQSSMEAIPLLDLTSGYVQRVQNDLPKQSTRLPWRLFQNYIYDKFILEFLPVKDRCMTFYK